MRARGGYFAVRSEGPVSAHVAPALALLENGSHPHAFEVSASARVPTEAADAPRISVEATVTRAALARLGERERQRHLDVTLLARIRAAPDGRPVEAVSQRCQVDLSQRTDAGGDCQLSREVSLPAGRYTVEVAAYEAESRAASVTVARLDVPAAVSRESTAAKASAKPGAGAVPDLPSPSLPQRNHTDPALASILERAGRYVAAYEETFCNIVAEETYTQWVGDQGAQDSAHGLKRRVTRADLVFVRLAGDVPWATFRDVFEVDGQRVRDREGRLVRLFAAGPRSVPERAKAIVEESAAYNIGTAVRTVNLPTLPLLFLHPGSQDRFSFRLGGRRRIGGVEGVEVGFEEVARPTFVRAEGSTDLPARGRFWIDGGRGTVLRSEVTYRFEPDRATARVTCEYRPQPQLAMWVPAEMKERYEDLPNAYAPLFYIPTEATARYSNLRQFVVTTEEKAELPPR